MTDPEIINSNLIINGQEDITQLTVEGHTTQTEPLQVWQDSAGDPLAQVTGDGRFQIGEMGMETPEALLEANASIDGASELPRRGWQSLGEISAAITDAVTWVMQELKLLGELTGIMIGSHTRVSLGSEADGSAAEVRAGQFEVVNEADALDRAVGVRSVIDNQAGTITQAVAFEVALPENNGTIATLIGLDIPDLTEGTENIAIRTGEGPVQFGDYLELTSPATTPAAPESGSNKVRVYPKTDGKLYARNDDDIEYDLTGAGGAIDLDGLSDVSVTSPVQGDILTRDGSQWVNQNIGTNEVVVRGGSGDVDGLAMSASTILARLASGNIVAATVSQIKTLLAIAWDDINDILTNTLNISDLIWAIVHEATNDGINRVGKLGMFLPSGSPVPAFGLEFSGTSGAELVTNGGFETGSFTSGWTASGSEWSVQSATVFAGTYAAKYLGADGISRTLTSDRIPVLALAPYDFDFHYYRDDPPPPGTAAPASLIVELRWYDASSGGSLLRTDNVLCLENNAWIQELHSYTAPSGALSAEIRLTGSSGLPNVMPVYIDSVSIKLADASVHRIWFAPDVTIDGGPLQLAQQSIPNSITTGYTGLLADLSGIPVSMTDTGVVMPLAARLLTYSTYSNSLSEINLFNESFLAGYVGANGVVNVDCWVRAANTSGTARASRVRLYLGSTLLFDHTSNNVVATSGRMLWHIVGTIRNRNSQSAQMAEGQITIFRNSGTTTDVAVDEQRAFIIESSENLASTFAIRLTHTWPAAATTLVGSLETGEIKVSYKP
jgi:hypothetical protein